MAMAYVTFEEYRGVGGRLDGARFKRLEPWAERVMDAWTVDRLRHVDWSKWTDQVHAAMAYLIDNIEEMWREEDADAVQSFSNGQDSYTFADPSGNPVASRVFRRVAMVLPVELSSQCVTYNTGCRKARW